MKYKLVNVKKSGRAMKKTIPAAMLVMILSLSNGFVIVRGTARAAVVNATITVTSTADDGTPGTLRQAIAAAALGDTIAFDALVFNSPQTITLTMGALVVANNVTIQGPGAALLSVSGNSASGVFDIPNGFTVTLSAMTIRDAGNVIQGGGIMNRGTATINDCVIRNNTANQGGGVQNDGTMIINNSTIQGNQAGVFGGGGVVAYGPLMVNNSLVANNSGFRAGGILVGGMSGLTINNSTISGNGSILFGGGIFFDAQQPGTVVNGTITNNRAGAGGGIYVNQGPVTLSNTIVALNLGPDATTPNDIESSGIGVNASSSYHNLIGAGGAGGLTDGANGNQVGVIDPGFAPLANNGGATLTHRLIANSPAINAGNNALAVDAANNPLTTDQRGAGFPRIVGGTVDIGAFELEAPSICPQPQGYWKNNPSAWPVASLGLGGKTYTQAELLMILNTPIGAGKNADASLILADQLIAAKLNIANGSDATPISATVAAADALLSPFSGRLPYTVKSATAPGQQMTALGAVLDQYNNGLLTAGCHP